MLNATLNVTVSTLLILLSGKSARTKQNPGTQRSIIKLDIHLIITKGKAEGEIDKEIIDNAVNAITPMYQIGVLFTKA